MSRWPSDTAYLIREESIQITHLGLVDTCPCWVFFDLSDTDKLVFEPKISLTFPNLGAGTNATFLLLIDGASAPIECYAFHETLSFVGDDPGYFVQLTPLLSGITLTWKDTLVRVESGIINFVQCWFPGRGTKARFALKFEEWTYSFVPVDDAALSYPKQLKSQRYQFTHHVTISRSGQQFTCAEASERLYELNMFMTLCKGGWASTALTSGISENGQVAMEEWGTHLLSSAMPMDSWMDRHHGESMYELFPLFVKKIQDPDWEDAIRTALYWYVRADTNHVGPDGGCLFLQAALERLAWHILVRDKQAISEKGFGDLTAADQMRLLLFTLGIPISIPTGCKDMLALAKGRNWKDAPQAVTEIRNRLVHPPKVSKQKQPLPYYEAHVTMKRYLELVILSACGYRGVYADRTNWPRNVGTVEPVPWA